MKIDTLAAVLVAVLAACWFAMLIGGLVFAAPFGVVGILFVLAVLAVLGWIFFRVVVERLRNAEDDYYEKNVKQ